MRASHMQHSLTSLFTSLPAQPAPERPAGRVAAADRAPPARPTRDEEQPAFRLPPEPREKARAAERARGRPDEPRPSPEARKPREAGEAVTGRNDPPRRSDPPRGADRARDGEPPCRQDPPRGPDRETGEPPRRLDPPGLTKTDKTSSSADAEATSEATAEGAALEAEIETASGEPAAVAGEIVTGGAQVVAVAEAPVANPSPAVEGTVLGETASQTSPSEAAAGHPAEPAAPVAEASQAEQPLTLDATEATPAAEAAASSPVVPGAPSASPQPQDSAAGVSALADAASGIGAKPASAQDKIIAQQERAELGDRSARTEAAKDAPHDASASGAGAAPGAPVKAETFPPSASEQSAPGLQAPPGSSGAAPPAQAASAPNGPAHVVSEVPLRAVAVEIGLKTLAGVNHFEIRLDPGELGRIEVRLEIDQDGGVKAHLTVDKVETLALLQRDARSLERAFEQAGLKPTDGSVDMSLRDSGRDQQGPGQGRQEHGGEPHRDAHARGSRRDEIDPALAEASPRRLWRGAAGVDVRV